MKDRSHLSEPAVRQSLMDSIFGYICRLCGKRSRDVDTISWKTEATYNNKWTSEVKHHRYHLICVRNVLNMGEELYSPHQVDVALDIIKKLKLRGKRRRAHNLFVLKSKVATLKEKEDRQRECNHALHELNNL